ncbi:MAG: competence protein CoiA family protein [Bacteroidota bacterium]
MQYALIDGIKREATHTGQKALCEGCKGNMISKCGDIMPHHWAHKSGKNCDSWREPETHWHRQWKNHFPPSFREVIFHDPELQKYHRADIHNELGLTIEFQNSAINLEEMLSREKFYMYLVWVINGAKLKGFTLGDFMPDPEQLVFDPFEIISGEQVTYTRKNERYLPPS